MTRAFNFCAGPAAIPDEVLLQAQEELMNWQGRGMSIMEMSHRGFDFEQLASEAEADLRELMQIPSHYRVLFLPAGARAQFAMLPLNLLGKKKQADYVNTGYWSQCAIKEATQYCEVSIAADSRITNYTAIPSYDTWQINPNAAYLHYTPNETISGVAFSWIPEIENIPLVADMSSFILSEPIDVSRYGVIYASAQKNIGPAGLSIVIIRDDLLGYASPLTPTIFNYKIQAENYSLANTPPTFAWYLSGLVFKWLKQLGGVDAISKINQRKAEKLYSLIDKSDLYQNSIANDCRSKMNVTFTFKHPELETLFLKEAESQHLTYLKGHKAIGGIRASIYNGVPETSVDALVKFMYEFEQLYV
ncbi:MAG: Phosphoserine aminotransferase [Legionellaceae bacterium]